MNEKLELAILFGQIRQIFESETLTWKQKFEDLFESGLSDKFQNFAPDFFFYDPDMDYEDDVTAFYNQAEDFVETLFK